MPLSPRIFSQPQHDSGLDDPSPIPRLGQHRQGTPVIGLYATSNPERSGPYLSRDLTINAYGDAAGRYLGKSASQLRWGQRVRDPGVMNLIRLKHVNEKIDQFFGK